MADDQSTFSGKYDSNLVIVTKQDGQLLLQDGSLGGLRLGMLIAPLADIIVPAGQNAVTLVGNNIMNFAQGHMNVTSGKETNAPKEEVTTEKKLKATIEQYKVKASGTIEKLIAATKKDPVGEANRVQVDTTGKVSSEVSVKAKGTGFERTLSGETFTKSASHEEVKDTLATYTSTKKGEQAIKFAENIERKSSEEFGYTETKETSKTRTISKFVLGKKVSKSTNKTTIPATPPVVPPTPPVVPPTPPVVPPTPPVVPPVTPITPDAPTSVDGGAEASEGAVLGARRGTNAGVLGVKRRPTGVLGEKRVLGARTGDESNTAAAYGMILGSVAMCGAWMTLRRKKKLQ